MITKIDKYTGSVRAIEFNPIQLNVFASVGDTGDESALYIWNLEKPEKPNLYFAPEGKNPHQKQLISNLSWNRIYEYVSNNIFLIFKQRFLQLLLIMVYL